MSNESHSLWNRVDGVLVLANKIAAGAASVTVFIMMFIVTADVFLRYVFNSPLQGTVELSEFMVVGVVYLSISYIQRDRTHLKIDAATIMLPVKARTAMDMFGYVLGIAFFAVVAWQGGLNAWKAYVTNDITMGLVPFPLWPAKLLLPLGSILICLQFVSDLVRDALKIMAPAEAGQAEGR